MAQQDKAVVDWAARLRASLAPRPAELAPVAETTTEAPAAPAREHASNEPARDFSDLAAGESDSTAGGDTIGLAAGDAIGLAAGDAIGLAAGDAIGLAAGDADSPVAGTIAPRSDNAALSELGPLGALLSTSPPAASLPSPLLMAPPAPPTEAVAPQPPAGLLSFLATAAPAAPVSPVSASPLLAALGVNVPGPGAADASQAAVPPVPSATPLAKVAQQELAPPEAASAGNGPQEASPAEAPAAPAPTPQTILSSRPVLKTAPAPSVTQRPAPIQAAPDMPAEQPVAAAPAPPPQPSVAKLPVATPAMKPTPGAAAAENPLGAAQVAAAYEAVCGAAMAAGADDEGAEWVGLAHSLDGARESWRALFLGVPEAGLPLAAALACRGRELAPVLHATESDPGRFGRLLAALEAEGLDGGETRLLQAAVGSDPDKLPPRGALAQDLLEREESWDYLRVGVPRLLPGMVTRALPTLTARVRWLMLAPLNRMEEGAAVKMLSGTWRLVAERPAALNLANPRMAERPGIQLWRGPLA